jgi:hypothetical protein
MPHAAPHKKKGPPASQRPKSREETPKEGGGNVREDIAAPHKYAPAPHKKQVPLTYSSPIRRMAVNKPAQPSFVG